MPSIIRKLDDTLINQIAAGEVVEHPASVIKEMVENSLDAGATSIFIEVKGGGRQMIRITDNGSGMGEEDALLAFERHATSKITSFQDFDALNSMGFRGEALASIASISKVSMKTRPHDLELGTWVQIEGGSFCKSSSIPCDKGTSIEAADLFFNVPARKKFLKSPAQDGLEIQKTVIQLALANPSVHFQLIADQEIVLDASASPSHFERARQLLHSEMTDQMQPFAFTEEDLKVEGLIGSPSEHRPNRTGQWLFINQRSVNSWVISGAVLDGYSTLIPERRFPVFVLHLTIPPSLVDVNVHPQKKEVRFRHDSLLREFIQKGISKQWESKPRFQPVIVEKAPSPPVWSKPLPLEKKLFSPPVMEVHEPAFFDSIAPTLFPNILGTSISYIFLDSHPLKDGEGICLLDCKRARARIIYERAMEGLKGRPQERQILLLPMTFPLNASEMLELNRSQSKLEALGFTVRQINTGSCMVEAVPLFLKDHEVENTLKALLEGFTDDQEVDLAKRLALKAANALQEKGSKLESDKARLLMKTLLACQQPYFSPKGEPIFAWIPNEELARHFK